MKTKIYTKTGDKGETSLFSGQRVSKNNPFIAAVGAVDECNSALGLAISFMPCSHELASCKEQLETIQHALFDIGAALSTPLKNSTAPKINKTRFDQSAIQLIEGWIDAMQEQLPELHTFILPGGHSAGATVHLARSFCRRAESVVVPLYQQGEIAEEVLIYLNRLSDYLFVASRYINLLTHSPETRWIKHN